MNGLVSAVDGEDCIKSAALFPRRVLTRVGLPLDSVSGVLFPATSLRRGSRYLRVSVPSTWPLVSMTVTFVTSGTAASTAVSQSAASVRGWVSGFS